jgi:hypothetical protein
MLLRRVPLTGTESAALRDECICCPLVCVPGLCQHQSSPVRRRLLETCLRMHANRSMSNPSRGQVLLFTRFSIGVLPLSSSAPEFTCETLSLGNLFAHACQQEHVQPIRGTGPPIHSLFDWGSLHHLGGALTPPIRKPSLLRYGQCSAPPASNTASPLETPHYAY